MTSLHSLTHTCATAHEYTLLHMHTHPPPPGLTSLTSTPVHAVTCSHPAVLQAAARRHLWQWACALVLMPPKLGWWGLAWHQLPKMSTVLSTWEALARPVYLHSPVFSHFSCFLPPPPLSSVSYCLVTHDVAGKQLWLLLCRYCFNQLSNLD